MEKKTTCRLQVLAASRTVLPDVQVQILTKELEGKGKNPGECQLTTEQPSKPSIIVIGLLGIFQIYRELEDEGLFMVDLDFQGYGWRCFCRQETEIPGPDRSLVTSVSSNKMEIQQN